LWDRCRDHGAHGRSARRLESPSRLDAGVQGIQKLAVTLNDAENGMLNPLE